MSPEGRGLPTAEDINVLNCYLVCGSIECYVEPKLSSARKIWYKLTVLKVQTIVFGNAISIHAVSVLFYKFLTVVFILIQYNFCSVLAMSMVTVIR